MIKSLELLEVDAQTKVIVLISKPPNPDTMEKVLEAAKSSRKPVVVNFLGIDDKPQMLGDLRSANTLEDAARIACELTGMEPESVIPKISEETIALSLKEHKSLAESQQYIRGLFSGGTLCYETQTILQPLIGDVFSNAPIKPDNKIPSDAPSKKHTCIDMGARAQFEKLEDSPRSKGSGDSCHST
jgi:FdrA protein